MSQLSKFDFETELYNKQTKLLADCIFDKRYWNDRKFVSRSIWLAEELKKVEFNSIYEIGMGCGRNLFYINNMFPDIRIGGSETNKSMLSFAKSILPDKCLIECEDAINTNTEDKFDIVFTHNILMHLPSRYVGKVIDKCVDKTSKYIIHLEKEGPEYIYKGPKELIPAIVSDELIWSPDIEAAYRIRRDCNVITSTDVEIADGGMAKLIVVEKSYL